MATMAYNHFQALGIIAYAVIVSFEVTDTFMQTNTS